MKAITTLLTTSLFAASVYAGSGTSDIYGGFAKDDPDLFQWQPSADEGMAGVQHAVVNVYSEFAGPDLPSSF